ncbi:helix-turn-helix transcriptional regulator [Lysinibacillus xylanilyticus]|uniref:helix-turn-helix transcriptional regulator n=1 Tax=Lysinibacillus xylanilyticus TaxID=582475 RepID=UPI00083C94FA
MRSNLKTLRQKKKLSVKKISQILGISTSHYYKIESGIRNPNFILAGNIAELFNCSVDEIFFKQLLDEVSKTNVS